MEGLAEERVGAIHEGRAEFSEVRPPREREDESGDISDRTGSFEKPDLAGWMIHAWVSCPWAAMGAGFFGGVAVMGMFMGGWVTLACTGCGVVSLGLLLEVVRRAGVARVRESTHWAGQLGRLSQVLGRAEEGVVVLDASSVVRWVSPSFCGISGLAPGEVLGKPFRLLDPATNSGSECAQFWKVLRDGGTWRGQFVNRRRNGSIDLGGQIVVGVRGSDGMIAHYVGVRRDSDRSGPSPEELTRANGALKSRLLEASAEFERFKRELERLMFAVGHQLRGAQVGSFEMKAALSLENPEVFPPQVRRDVQWMMRSGARLMRLLESLAWLHELSRRPLKRERVDLSALAEEVLGGFQEVDPGRSIQTLVEAGIHAVGDPRMLRVVLTNLLGNAWKHGKGAAQEQIEFGSVVEPGETRSFFVRDNGVGLDVAAVSRVLRGEDLSGYLDASEEPRLGLMVVSRVVERHNGRVWVEGGGHRGATFRFTLGDEPGSFPDPRKGN